MALRFRQVPPDLADTLEIGAGILVVSAAGTVEEVLEDNYSLLGATDGGVSFKATPKITSFSMDGGSRPEARWSRLDGWTAKMSGTLKTVTRSAYWQLTETTEKEGTDFMVQVKDDEDGEDEESDSEAPESGAHTYFYTRDSLRFTVREEDYSYEEPDEDEDEDEEEEEEEEEPLNSLWWIGDYGQSGGYLAIRLRNAYSSGGFQLSTKDGETGSFKFEFTGYYDGLTEDDMPFECYISDGTGSDTI